MSENEERPQDPAAAPDPPSGQAERLDAAGQDVASTPSIPATSSTPAAVAPARPRVIAYLILNAGFWVFLTINWLVWRSLLTRNWGALAHPQEFRAPDRGIILFCLLLAGAFALVSVFDYLTRRQKS